MNVSAKPHFRNISWVSSPETRADRGTAAGVRLKRGAGAGCVTPSIVTNVSRDISSLHPASVRYLPTRPTAVVRRWTNSRSVQLTGILVGGRSRVATVLDLS